MALTVAVVIVAVAAAANWQGIVITLVGLLLIVVAPGPQAPESEPAIGGLAEVEPVGAPPGIFTTRGAASSGPPC